MTWYSNQYVNQYAAMKEDWYCALCWTSNYAKKKVCRKCGAKKAYAQHVANTETEAGHDQHTSQDQWQWPAHQQSGSAAQGPQGEHATEAHEAKPAVSRGALSASINALEKAKKDLTAEHGPEETIHALNLQIAGLKARITDMRPIEDRVKQCRDALARAKEKHGRMQAALRTAMEDEKSAAELVAKREKELEALEAQSPTAHLQHAATNAFRVLSDTLAKVVTADSLETARNGLEVMQQQIQQGLATTAALAKPTTASGKGSAGPKTPVKTQPAEPFARDAAMADSSGKGMGCSPPSKVLKREPLRAKTAAAGTVYGPQQPRVLEEYFLDESLGEAAAAAASAVPLQDNGEDL